jgi:ornithine carbamoyltransferase
MLSFGEGPNGGIIRTAVDLQGRHLLTLNDYAREEITYLIDLAADLKSAKYHGREEQLLTRKQIALLSETDSIRARCAIDVAAHDQGAHVTVVGPIGPHLGYETVKDTVRVLGRMYDAIEYRGACESVADELAKWSGVPVYWGPSDERHPAQILADFLTLDEHVDKPLNDVTFCYLGDARFSMAGTYLIAGAKLGMDMRIASPRALWPSHDILNLARQAAALGDGRVTVTDDVEQAVLGCDVLVTDRWVSTGEPGGGWGGRIELLLPYQVNARTMQLTGNPDVRFMHGLPAVHNTDTDLGKVLAEQYGLDALEVTEEVFESGASLVFDEAGNRVHTIKAVLVATLGDGRAKGRE